MNKIVKDIVAGKEKKKDKEKALQALMDDIRIANLILSGHFKYCPKCDDYYITDSFLLSTETKPAKLCNKDHTDRKGSKKEIIKSQYLICPKGHRLKFDKNDKQFYR